MNLKRLLDIVISLTFLIALSPILILFSLLVFFQDFNSPFYVADRVGKNNKIFRMIKLRSMVVNADKSGVDSTSSNDQRITRVGKLVRKYKLDELTQFLNVLRGDMSLVGPRPNVLSETRLYSEEESRLLKVKPGITDFSSIVFSDEGEILKDSNDPDIDYNQLIRPGKSSLGLFYIDNMNLRLDLYLCLLTGVAVVSRDKALKLVTSLLKSLNASNDLVILSRRDQPLKPLPPPGFEEIVSNR